MKYSKNIAEVATVKPDYMGFIFWEKSPRVFNGEMPVLSNAIRKTGVFVNEEEHTIRKKVQQYELSAIQLHGDESPEFCAAFKNESTEVIKAFAVDEHFDFETLKRYEACDYFLFDAKGKLRGGNGQTFNWRILEKHHIQKPIFLSGGIGIEEIPHIAQLQFPVYAVDVNSRFEVSPGHKKICELQEFKNQLP